MGNNGMLSIIAEDSKAVLYRPALLKITKGSIPGAILLSQIIYWDNIKGGKFYKFGEPCASEKYTTGDSWLEELGFSQKVVSTALKSIGFKLGKKNKERYGVAYKKEKLNHIVLYYTDSNRITWYTLNRDLLGKLLSGVYKEKYEQEVTLNTENTNREYPQDTPISPPPPPVVVREGEKLSFKTNEQSVSPETEFVVGFDNDDFWKTIDDIRKNKALKTRFERVDHTRTRTGLSTLLSLRLGTPVLTTSELLPIWTVLRAGPSKFNILKLKIEILTRMLSDNYYQEDSISELLAAWYLEKSNYPEGITSDAAYISYLLERLASLYDSCYATHPTIEKFLEVHTEKL